MTIQEINALFGGTRNCTMATINGKYPETRIADFLCYDEDGLYFFTMKTKPFYKQVKESLSVSICGLSAQKQWEWIDGQSYNEPAYFIRVTGDVREFTIEEAKAKNPELFQYLIEDQERYPQITAFCLYKFHGEIYDYDFAKEKRNHKLERKRFSFGGMPFIEAGLAIDKEKCIACGKCEKNCTFDAIYKDGGKYNILPSHCDECGNCYTVCPANAITRIK